MFAFCRNTLACNLAFALVLLSPLHLAAKEKGGKEASKAKFKKHWDIVGPFVRGNFEIDGDPMEFYGGIKNVKRGGSQRFISEVATGSYVGWQSSRMNPDGSVIISHDSRLVDFQFLKQSLSDEIVTNTQSWAVGDLVVPQDGTYVIRCSGVHSIEIESRLIRGTHEAGFPLKLGKGTYVVYVKVSGQGPQLHFQCSARAAKHVLELFPPEAAPHIHDGHVLGTPFIAPKVMNLGKKWIDTRELEFYVDRLSNHRDISTQVEVEKEQPHFPKVLAPGLLLQMPLKLQITTRLKGKVFPDADCVHFDLKLRKRPLEDGAEVKELGSVRMKLTCRQRQQSFLFTFLDSDSSVSHAAAIKPRCGKPWKPCRPRPFPIALTLSGVSVGPLNQADSYKIGAEEDGKFLFGFKEAWTLCPERGGPHNWEDWGYKTVLRSLEELTSAANGTEFSVNPDRLFIAGHSRGGHGAWSVAVRMPDRALGVSAAGGWTYRQYGGVSWNTAFFHDTQNGYLDLELKAILERCMIEGNTELAADNLKGLPVLVRQGSQDRTVTPFLNRRMARNALEAGAKVEISEIIGQGHWWWDTKEPNDGGVVNDAIMRAFSTKSMKTLELPPLPTSFRVTVINPSSFSGRAGIRVLQTEVPFRRAFVDVHRHMEGVGTWELRTVNVRRFSFSPVDKIAEVSVDGSVLSMKGLGKDLCRANRQASWMSCPDVAEYERRERGPDTWGPARQVVLSPFAIVAYVEGDGEEFATAVWDVARYVSHGHLMAVNSNAPVLRPEDVSDDVRRTRNLIHIGGPAALQTALSAEARARWPVGIEPAACSESSDTCLAVDGKSKDNVSAFAIGPCRFQSARHGIVFTAPRWEDGAGSNGRAFIDLVVSGTDAIGLLDVSTYHHKHLSRSPFANMVPDFFVSGPEYRAKGFGGLAAAGFWGSQWEWRSDSSYMEC